ncbi:hypothetical protein LC612_41615, partial [Nostoc sp. CHAB 5834]|nr:hypothetical protein [Nostoc sp. CHAB 5834]
MATSNGKVVGARLPLPDYIELLAKAADLKLNVSDYVLLKLYAPADPSAQPLQKARQKVDQLKARVASLETEKATLEAEKVAFSKANQDLQKHTRQSEQAHQQKTRQAQEDFQTASQQQQDKINKLTQELD